MRGDLERIFRAGVGACRPERVLPPHLPPPPAGTTFVLALGKAAGAMASVAEARAEGPLAGLAIVPDGVEAALGRIELVHGSHPVPDERSVAAAGRLLRLASSAGADDLVLVLLSGGASSLACLPSPGLGLAAKQALTQALLRSGAPIGEVNCVRRHLSRIKGGRLAFAAAPARLLTLAISDVPGDAPADIGSGPTAADPTTVADARRVLARHGLEAPAASWSETPDRVPGEFRLVARPADAIAAAAAEARRLGWSPVVLGECAGEAREVARAHAGLALNAAPGTALISGGELQVRVTGGGSGGRNREYALAAALALAGRDGIAGLAADTDGIDGDGPAAGAFFAGIADPAAAAALDDNDSGTWFACNGGAFVTGPTGTNVNDLRILLVTS
jgi:hydroxypyruvate reductase